MKEIALIVGVSLSSVSNWVRDVPLTEEQLAVLRWRDPSRNGQRNGAAANRDRGRARRLAQQRDGRRHAGLRGRRHLAGCMLFWAEGSRARNAVVFNSDPDMVRSFVEFLRSCYGVSDEAFRVDCNLFADHVERQQEIEQFWLDTLGVQSTYGAIQEYGGFERPEWLG